MSDIERDAILDRLLALPENKVNLNSLLNMTGLF